MICVRPLLPVHRKKTYSSPTLNCGTPEKVWRRLLATPPLPPKFDRARAGAFERFAHADLVVGVDDGAGERGGGAGHLGPDDGCRAQDHIPERETLQGGGGEWRQGTGHQQRRENSTLHGTRKCTCHTIRTI